jgi:hypothetical protein
MCAFTKTILCMLWGYYLFAPPTFAQRGRPAPPVRTAPAADTVLQRFADGRISVTKVTRVPQHEFVYRVWSPQGIVEQEFEELDYSFRQTVRFAFRQDGSVQEVWVKTIPDAGIQSGHVHYTFNAKPKRKTTRTCNSRCRKCTSGTSAPALGCCSKAAIAPQCPKSMAPAKRCPPQ